MPTIKSPHTGSDSEDIADDVLTVEVLPANSTKEAAGLPRYRPTPRLDKGTAKPAQATLSGDGIANHILTVVVGHPDPANELVGQRYASIIALSKGENVATKSRICLHVMRTRDGEDEFADGVLGVKGKALVIRSSQPWPEMWKALSRPVKAFAGLTNTRRGEPPYLRVKNLHEDGYCICAPLEEGAVYGIYALAALSNWNQWQNGDVQWRARLDDLHPKALISSKSSNDLHKMANSLEKFCADIGLQNGNLTDFREAYTHLSICLDTAHTIFSQLHTELKNGK